MRRRVAAPLFATVLAFACAAPPPPAPSPEPPPVTAPATPSGEVAIGSVRVTASTLNVRSQPSTDAPSIAQVRKGDQLTLIATGDEWMKVRLADGAIGWVSKQHVTSSSSTASATRPRRTPAGCQPDRNYSFANSPTPRFTENGAHGIVTVEATVDKNGVVQSTKVISNTTGDNSLATIAEREIATARFVPPIRNCVAKAFIFTYKRSF